MSNKNKLYFFLTQFCPRTIEEVPENMTEDIGPESMVEETPENMTLFTMTVDNRPER